jgi:hypothetical protein
MLQVQASHGAHATIICDIISVVHTLRMAAESLTSVVQTLLLTAVSPNLLVGASTCDDAAVYKINEQQAIVLTTDFFMPIGEAVFKAHFLRDCKVTGRLFDRGCLVYAVLWQGYVSTNYSGWLDCW